MAGSCCDGCSKSIWTCVPWGSSTPSLKGASIPVVDADGTCHRKVEQGHVRHLATVFGTVRVTRCAWRADGTRNLYPADAALNLPCRLHSQTLRRRAAIEAARGSFGAAQQALTRACGRVAGKRQVQQPTVAAATDIDAFSTTCGAAASHRRHVAGARVSTARAS
jgi:hypothetical protein